MGSIIILHRKCRWRYKIEIALALGGGGSRGFAHIGVIRRLEKLGFEVRALAGSSVGGLAAILIAAGYSADKLETLFSGLDQSKFFGLAPRDAPALLGLTGAARMLSDLLGDRTFKDLDYPCAVTATDIQSGREVVLKQGGVLDAVLATTALPGIFPPKSYLGYQLVDGGVIDPVPVSVARSLAPALPVVAVILSSCVDTGPNLPRLPLPLPVPTPIVERLTRLRVAQAIGIFLQAVDVGGCMLAELRLQAEHPEVIIRPAVGRIGLLDNVDVHQIVHLGELAADTALPELKSVFTWQRRLGRRYFPRW